MPKHKLLILQKANDKYMQSVYSSKVKIMGTRSSLSNYITNNSPTARAGFLPKTRNKASPTKAKKNTLFPQKNEYLALKPKAIKKTKINPLSKKPPLIAARR